MKIHIKKTDNLAIPSTGTPQSSGYDVVVLEEPKIVGVKDIHREEYWTSIDYIEYHTGLSIAPQTDNYGHNYHTLIFPRSSIREYNLVLANSIALIDNDYRGEIILCFKYIFQPEDLHPFTAPLNSSIPYGIVRGEINKKKIYNKGDKIGQLVTEITNNIDWVVVADLSITDRGSGGFGSTTESKKKVTLSAEHPVPSPKEASSMIDIWKEATAEEKAPEKYESAVREREKQLQR